MSDLTRTVAEVRAALAKVAEGQRADLSVLWIRPGRYMINGPDTTTALAELHGQSEGWLSALCDGVEAMQQECAATEHVDLMVDEFKRIRALMVCGFAGTSEAEIIGLCDRAIMRTIQHVAVIAQRDKAEAERDAAYARGRVDGEEACAELATYYVPPRQYSDRERQIVSAEMDELAVAIRARRPAGGSEGR